MPLTNQNPHTNSINTQNVLRRQNKPRDHVRQRSIRSIIASDSSNSKIIYVYCSPRLKNALTCILRFIIVAYCITVPLFVYLLHKESSENILKLDNLERRLAGHMKNRPRRSSDSSAGNHTRVRRSYDSKERNKTMKLGMESFNKKYKILPGLKKKFNQNIKELNETVIAYGNRMKEMQSAEDWVYKVYNKYILPNITRKNCTCDSKAPRPKTSAIKMGPSSAKSVDTTGAKTNRTNKNLLTTYTRWGGTSCKGTNGKLVYTGFMGGALPRTGTGSMKQGGGVNYLCLPNQPKYGKYVKGRSSRRTYIDGVIYGRSFRNIDNLANKVIPCAVCESTGRTAAVMMPGTDRCKENWTEEYNGVIATDGSENQRTEYICLDKNLEKGTYVQHNMRSTIGSLDTVAVKCMKGILPCGANDKYKEDTILPCVVCSR